MKITVQTTGLDPDNMRYDLTLDRDEFKALCNTLVRYFESLDPNDEVDAPNGVKMFRDMTHSRMHYMMRQLEMIGAKETIN